MEEKKILVGEKRILAAARPTIPAIQALRAAAALLVVFVHLPQAAVLVPKYKECGAVGVDIFFVISGFIMVYSSSNSFARKSAGWRFLHRRLIRILPLYWSTTTILILMVVSGWSGWNGRSLSPSWIAASYLFLPFNGLMPINAVGWSLDYEMLFYAFFAGVICLRMKGAVCLISILFACMAVVHYRVGSPLLWKWTNPIIGEFAAGALLGFYYVRGVRVPNTIAVGLMVAGVSVFVAASVFVYPPLSVLTGPEILRPLVWGLPATLIVAGITLACRPIRQRRLLKIGTLLGDASYGIYLLHPLLLPFVVFPLWRTMSLGMGYVGYYLNISASSDSVMLAIAAAGSGLGTMIVIAIVSVIVFTFFEQPVTHYLRDCLRKR